jgi:hypothetical protein
VFFVGEKVKCINDSNWPTPRQFGAYTPILPVRGRVYTVRDVVPMMRKGWDEDGLFLEEIVNPIRTKPDGSTFELAFRMSRFRSRTNISVFRRMLETVPARQPAETHSADLTDEPVRFVLSAPPGCFVGWQTEPADAPPEPPRKPYRGLGWFRRLGY